MTNERNPDPLALSKPKCIYRNLYESGNSSTFEEPLNPDLRKCISCNGTDANCGVYQDLVRFAEKIKRFRDEVRREKK